MANRNNDDILEILEVGLTVHLVDRQLLPADVAKRELREYFAGIRESYGGERYMLRRGYRKYSPAMKRRIAGEFDGRNARQLILRYGISSSTFYDIVKQFG